MPTPTSPAPRPNRTDRADRTDRASGTAAPGALGALGAVRSSQAGARAGRAGRPGRAGRGGGSSRVAADPAARRAKPGRGGARPRPAATSTAPPPSLDNPHDIGNAPSRLPVWLQRAMLAFFVLGFITATLFSLTEHWRRATFTLGATMLWLTVCRLSCDSQVMGLLAVRSRRFDALFCTSIGVLLVWLAVSVDSLGS